MRIAAHLAYIFHYTNASIKQFSGPAKMKMKDGTRS